MTPIHPIGTPGVQRCFVLGSGPSIKRQDLRPLKHQTTFCTNWFLNHPDMNEIDINYYCACDDRFVSPEPNLQWVQAVCRYKFQRIFLPEDWLTHLLPFDNITYIPFHRGEKVALLREFSTNFQRGFLDGDTVIISMCLPLAMAMGFKEIVLLGCDCTYGIADRGDTNDAYFYSFRFHSTAFEHTAASEKSWQADILVAYSIVRSFAENSGVRIVNATEGGVLDVFDRAPLHALLKGNE